MPTLLMIFHCPDQQRCHDLFWLCSSSQSSARGFECGWWSVIVRRQFKILCRAMMAKWRKWSKQLRRMLEMTTQSDDEYDTLNHVCSWWILIAQDPTKRLNHNLNQVTQSLVSGIPLDYIQPPSWQFSSGLRVFDDSIPMYKSGCFNIFPRCICQIICTDSWAKWC